MPSELQLQRAIQEIRDLENELKLLNEAVPPEKSVDRIQNFIINTPEPLSDLDNTPYPTKCKCVLL